MNKIIPLRELKGIGDKTAKLFQKLHIETVRDLLHYYPRNYEVYEVATPIGNVEEGKMVTVTGTIYGKVQLNNAKNMQITSIHVKDMTGVIKATWFRMPFLKKTLGRGGVITLRGRVVDRRGQLCLEQPEIFYPSGTYDSKVNTLQPVYSLTSGLTNNQILKLMKQAIEYFDLEKEFLPQSIRLDHHLAEYNFAMRQIHFPQDMDSFMKARERLVFEEFLVFILTLRSARAVNEKMNNSFSFSESALVERVTNQLPYRLTGAQQKVWNEIKADLSGEHVMSRLIQGDVGSGKTILAILSLILVGSNGYQGAMMAPTEVLAKQHYLNITNLFEKLGVSLRVVLLTGSMTAKEKKAVYEEIESGRAQIIVGTHALIQGMVQYHKLALVVTDEQHRFGVKQRETLAEKGHTPHVLVMSATPIPRTLAIILYGDLDISVVDELPANRIPIKNCVVDTGYRKTAYNFIKNQVAQGRQCYVICPMVEDSEYLDAENVSDYAKMLQTEFGSTVTVGQLHGRMKQSEKDEIMEKFSNNEIQVLVSTTVIEVGIDVPNATVMMIENAERFGLAQLHQLRGRVGRGQEQSYCIFMTSSKSNVAKERLSILNKSNDGFLIASEDLKLRGPGDLFGIRQSGILDFKLGDVFQDAEVLKQASEAATQLMKQDPNLEKEENRNLKEYLNDYMTENVLEKTL